MIDTPHLAETTAGPTAVIHLTVPRDQIQAVMSPAHAEVLAAVAAQGLEATGPWFTHHLRMAPGTFDLEVGVPVSAPVASSGRVVPGARTAQFVAQTVYAGGYEGLGAAWGAFDAWIAAQKLSPAGDLWEVYAVGSESGDDPSAWRTELSRPLAATLPDAL